MLSTSGDVVQQPMIVRTPVQSTPPIDNSKKRLPKPTLTLSGTNKRTKKKAQMNLLIMKGLGRWKPTDDLALIIGVQQVCNERKVYIYIYWRY